MPRIEVPVERACIVVRVAIAATSGERHVEGLLDTGTPRSFISSHLAGRLALASNGFATVTSMGIEEEVKPTYPVHLRVPAPQFETAPADDHFRRQIAVVGSDRRFDGKYRSQCDVLLGMDLISQWRVEINNGLCIISW